MPDPLAWFYSAPLAWNQTGVDIQLGKSLGLTTVAEGMETRDQAEMLRAAGCDVGQGRLFSRPMAARDVPSFLTQAGRSREMESEVSYTSAA